MVQIDVRMMMNRYITNDAEEDIVKFLAEWETGRYGKKLTWTILVKSFGYSRQALSGNKTIKEAYNNAKEVLKGACSEIDVLSDIAKENKQLKKALAEAQEIIHLYEQKYIRWQSNCASRGISVDVLNKPIAPSIKEELRKRDKEV